MDFKDWKTHLDTRAAEAALVKDTLESLGLGELTPTPPTLKTPPKAHGVGVNKRLLAYIMERHAAGVQGVSIPDLMKVLGVPAYLINPLALRRKLRILSKRLWASRIPVVTVNDRYFSSPEPTSLASARRLLPIGHASAGFHFTRVQDEWLTIAWFDNCYHQHEAFLDAGMMRTQHLLGWFDNCIMRGDMTPFQQGWDKNELNQSMAKYQRDYDTLRTSHAELQTIIDQKETHGN
jgi:hypothetical protein